MTETAKAMHAAIRIDRMTPPAPILMLLDGKLAVRAGAGVYTESHVAIFTEDTELHTGDLEAGCDYSVSLGADGKPVVQRAESNPLLGDGFAGFHYAPGGNAEGRNGGSKVPAVNPFSFWDLEFRPSCADPRGMTLVEDGDVRLWVDIYLLGKDHKAQGTSRHGAEIADGASLDLLDFKTADSILSAHGKRMMTYDEFRAAAYGVTEKTATRRDPVTTGLDAERTSRAGLMQATGNLWIWGTDGDPDDPRPSVFGGSWLDGGDAGSRYAFLGFWPGGSYVSISARGACGHLTPA
jgi:hypothetical protein